MLAIDEPRVSVGQHGLRPLDVTRDLNQVADLIELCFASTMDPDGEEYLRQMRRMARDLGNMRWAAGLAESTNTPVSGLVYEENGRILGNLSLIPMWKAGKRVYLIANVAVHPDQRRHGIARRLTEAGLRYAHDRGASAWLQVRVENQAAVQLYRETGFEERARRTTWLSPAQAAGPPDLRGLRITPRYPSDWPVQKAWLRTAYPAEVAWYLPIHLASLGPGLIDGLARFLNNERIQHWAARDAGKLTGLLTWQRLRGYSDPAWLALDPQAGEDTLTALLAHARRAVPPGRLLSINYQSGVADHIFTAAGFTIHQTLVWMESPTTLRRMV